MNTGLGCQLTLCEKVIIKGKASPTFSLWVKISIYVSNSIHKYKTI
jgi:hypothetical protein